MAQNFQKFMKKADIESDSEEEVYYTSVRLPHRELDHTDGEHTMHMRLIEDQERTFGNSARNRRVNENSTSQSFMDPSYLYASDYESPDSLPESLLDDLAQGSAIEAPYYSNWDIENNIVGEEQPRDEGRHVRKDRKDVPLSRTPSPSDIFSESEKQESRKEVSARRHPPKRSTTVYHYPAMRSPSTQSTASSIVVKSTISEDLSRQDKDKGAKLRYLSQRLERNGLGLRNPALR